MAGMTYYGIDVRNNNGNGNNNSNSPNNDNNNPVIQELIRQVSNLTDQVTMVNERLGVVVNPNMQEMIPEGFEDIDMITYERNVIITTAFPDVQGARDIVSTPAEALIGHDPEAVNIPGAGVRLNALISLMYKLVNPGREITTLIKKHIRLHLRRLARECRIVMKIDGVHFTFWSEIPLQQQLFYAIKLERTITAFGYPIFRCKRQWGAKLLIQEAMKSERQVERRRLLRLEASNGQ